MFEYDRKITIEIGTTEEKNIIKDELRSLFYFFDILDMAEFIKHIYIPLDFDKKINELQGSEDYSSKSDPAPFGKVVHHDDNSSIIFNYVIYTEGFDYHFRLFLYLHELMHITNKSIFPIIEDDSPTNYQNLENLYILYDEYVSDRRALETLDKIFAEKSIFFKRKVYGHLKSQIKTITDKAYYERIKREILFFRFHHDIHYFTNNIVRYFDNLSKAMIHAIAFIDHLPRLKKLEILLNKSYFVNNRTLALIDFYRNKYKDNDVYLFDGIHLMHNYKKNFGMKFEDMEGGLYCHVLDI